MNANPQSPRGRGQGAAIRLFVAVHVGAVLLIGGLARSIGEGLEAPPVPTGTALRIPSSAGPSDAHRPSTRVEAPAASGRTVATADHEIAPPWSIDRIDPDARTDQ